MGVHLRSAVWDIMALFFLLRKQRFEDILPGVLLFLQNGYVVESAPSTGLLPEMTERLYSLSVTCFSGKAGGINRI